MYMHIKTCLNEALQIGGISSYKPQYDFIRVNYS